MTTDPCKPVYLVVGVPCSGKSWVCEQLRELYEYVPHDDHIGGNYPQAIRGRSLLSTKPVLAETPFSMSQIVEPLEKYGLKVVPVFIIEEPAELQRRYRAREGKDIPQGHLTRQETYYKRSTDGGWYRANSANVLAHLQRNAGWKWPWQT